MNKVARLIGGYLNLLARIVPSAAGRQGFNLFCTPQAPPVKSHHREFFNTSRMEVIPHGEINLQTYRWGEGPRNILLLHGWQSHSFRWKTYIDAFVKEGYSVYAMDAPAHGLSTGKYINLPIYAGAIERAVNSIGPVHAVISHSFGSFSSIYALHRNPALAVEKLIIMGTPGEATDFVHYYRQVLGLSDRAMKCVADHFVKAVGQDPAYFSAPAFAATLTVPGLIVHDEQDDETPYRHALRIHAAWKNSGLLATSGLGHNLKSAEVLKSVVAFVGGSPAASPFELAGTNYRWKAD